MINEIFEKKLIIQKYDQGDPLNRTLSSKFHLLGEFFANMKMENALMNLKNYIYKEKY